MLKFNWSSSIRGWRFSSHFDKILSFLGSYSYKKIPYKKSRVWSKLLVKTNDSDDLVCLY